MADVAQLATPRGSAILAGAMVLAILALPDPPPVAAPAPAAFEPERPERWRSSSRTVDDVIECYGPHGGTAVGRREGRRAPMTRDEAVDEAMRWLSEAEAQRDPVRATRTDVAWLVGQGDLDKAVIRRYLRQNLVKLAQCHERYLMHDATLGGTIEGAVEVTLLIGVDGAVVSSSAHGSTRAVSACVTGVIRGIAFPRARSGGRTQVAASIRFPGAL